MDHPTSSPTLTPTAAAHKPLESSSDPLSSRPSKPIPNGTVLKKHHQIRHPQPHPPPSLYRECLKNHAASLGAHALDGCGEFMPSPTSTPSDPSSLTCAACGCHRNFHRRLLPHHPLQLLEQQEEDEEEHGDEGSASQNDHHTADEEVNRRTTSPPPPSAPHMLLALSTGLTSVGATAGVGPATMPRKRFRSKFSPEQKERMHELSERLGWRMQKRDEGIVEECCGEIGVGKGVFKVWMHNNKHNFKNNAAVDAATNVNANNGSGGESHHIHRHGTENGSGSSS